MWTIKRKGLTLSITPAEMADPRQNEDNLGKMICFHRRYALGDKHEYAEPFDLQMFFENNKNKICCILPLYLLDHSGLTMSTTSFNDPWDSGQIGFIYCTNEDVKKFGMDPEKDFDDVKQTLIDEVKTYDKWLTGYPQYFRFIITDENDNIIENRCFFEFTNLKDMLNEMKKQTDENFGFLFDKLYQQQSDMNL